MLCVPQMKLSILVLLLMASVYRGNSVDEIFDFQRLLIKYFPTKKKNIAADAPALVDFPTHDLHDVNSRDLELFDDGRPSQVSLPDDLTQVFAPLPVPPVPT